jgi:Fe2+ transport system protein FeoA
MFNALLPQVPLSLVTRGRFARISEVVGTCDDVRRLAEIGLRPGVHVEMLQPGSPCIIRAGESRYCLRDTDLCQVLVNLDDAA